MNPYVPITPGKKGNSSTIEAPVFSSLITFPSFQR